MKYLPALAAVCLMGCAGLVVKDRDSPASKIGKVFVRVVLAPSTFLISELIISEKADEYDCRQHGRCRTYDPAMAAAIMGTLSRPASTYVPQQTIEHKTVIYHQIGNTLYGNDGTSYRQVGNVVYGSNGSSCSLVGSSWYCGL